MKQKNLLVNITIVRGLLALMLGVLLLVSPITWRPFAFNFMGIYWLLGGFVSIQVARNSSRAKGIRLLVGVIGIVAGVALLTRTLTVSLIPQPTVMLILGMLILLSGLLHIFTGLRLGEKIGRGWEIANVLLGVFEVGFGLLMMLYPWVRFERAYLAFVAWALLGGIILLGDGLRLRRLLHDQERSVGKST